MPENDCEAVAEFIRIKGITRCPTVCILPTQGFVAAADRIALEEHAVARDLSRRARAAARWRGLWNVDASRSGSVQPLAGFRTAKHPDKPLMRQ